MRGWEYWNNDWHQESYKNTKKQSFDAISKVVYDPKTILDIGCGFAYESQWMQEKYNCKLYLLDGDCKANSEIKKRDVSFGEADNFGYYLPIETLVKSWQDRGLKYTYIDAEKPVLHNEIFDVVYSNVSCGFHYPISPYNWLLKKHTDKNTIIIFDIRTEYFSQAAEEYEIVSVLYNHSKYKKCQIKLKV